MSSKSEHWAIIGGGILGMTLAHRLAQSGKKVTLFEGAKELGGLASAWNLGNIVWDRHYHVTLLSDTYFRSLLAELGLEQEMEWVQTQTGFYTDGKFYSMSNSLDFLLFPPLSWLDKIRLAITILYASRIKNWQTLEQIPVTKWLRQWSGTKTFEKIWLPLLRAKLGENYKKASAAFIWAIIARLYAARRTGLKKEMFGYLPGGYARILERFAEVLTKEKVDIKLQYVAKKVESTNDGRVSIQFKNEQRHIFDQVVLTTAAPIAAQICSGLTNEEIFKHKQIQYQGVICASLLLKKPLSQYYVTNITDSWVPFTGIIEMSTLVDRKHFGGNSLVYIPKYVTPEDPAFSLSDRELEDIFVGALMRIYPHLNPSDILSFRVSRVRYVLAISTLNYSKNLPSMSTSIPGVSIVNSAHIANGTLNVNESIQLAEKTIKKLLLLPQQDSFISRIR